MLSRPFGMSYAFQACMDCNVIVGYRHLGTEGIDIYSDMLFDVGL